MARACTLAHSQVSREWHRDRGLEIIIIFIFQELWTLPSRMSTASPRGTSPPLSTSLMTFSAPSTRPMEAAAQAALAHPSIITEKANPLLSTQRLNPLCLVSVNGGANMSLISLSFQMPRPALPPRSSGRRSRLAWRGTRWRLSVRSWRSARPRGRQGDRPRPRPRPPQPLTARPGQWARPGRLTRRLNTSFSSQSPSLPEWHHYHHYHHNWVNNNDPVTHRTWSKAGTSRWFSTKSVANLTIRRIQRRRLYE